MATAPSKLCRTLESGQNTLTIGLPTELERAIPVVHMQIQLPVEKIGMVWDEQIRLAVRLDFADSVGELELRTDRISEEIPELRPVLP
jgi:hypothetical protein